MTERGQDLDTQTRITGEIDRVRSHLVKQLRGRLHEAEVSVYRGGIMIRGKANSYYVKQLAQHAVMNSVSLPITANEIEVVETYGRRR